MNTLSCCCMAELKFNFRGKITMQRKKWPAHSIPHISSSESVAAGVCLLKRVFFSLLLRFSSPKLAPLSFPPLPSRKKPNQERAAVFFFLCVPCQDWHFRLDQINSSICMCKKKCCGVVGSTSFPSEMYLDFSGSVPGNLAAYILHCIDWVKSDYSV